MPRRLPSERLLNRTLSQLHDREVVLFEIREMSSGNLIRLRFERKALRLHDEIGAVLDEDDPELVHKRLLGHRDRLADRLAAQDRTLAYLETLIQRKEGIMPYAVEITEVPPRLVAATTVHTNLSPIGDDIGVEFGALMMAMDERASRRPGCRSSCT